MWIVVQDRHAVLNAGACLGMGESRGEVYAKTINNDSAVILGEYSNPIRAQEVFSEMLKEMFPPEMIVIKNMEVSETVQEYLESHGCSALVANDGKEPCVKAIEPRVYYMPEE